MKKKKNQNIIKISPESTTVEWKPSLPQIKEIINTISAFSKGNYPLRAFKIKDTVLDKYK